MLHILFPYIAQPHQEFHSLPIALEMARLYPEIKVHIASLTPERDSRIRALCKLYPNLRSSSIFCRCPGGSGTISDSTDRPLWVKWQSFC